MKVFHITRKPGDGHYSIEGTFSALRQSYSSKIELCQCPEASQGVFARVRNILWAKKLPLGIHHILGDVHYVALGTNWATTILTVHDCGFAFHANPVKRALLRFLWLSVPVRLSTKVTAVSNKTKREIISLTRVDADKIVVIPDCISDAFQYAPKSFQVKRPVILQVGTRPNKNVVRLIQALEGIPCELHIVGKVTSEIEEALQTYQVSAKVSLDLSLSELVDAYRCCDIVSFVSTYEGFGMPIVEANAVGRAVITSSIEPMVSVSGGSVALADPYSASAIRDSIKRLIEDGAWRDELVRKGLLNAKLYRSEVVSLRYQRLYDEVWADAQSS